jgi:hypothetical protein
MLLTRRLLTLVSSHSFALKSTKSPVPDKYCINAFEIAFSFASISSAVSSYRDDC